MEDSEDIKPSLQRQVGDALKRAQNLGETELAQAQKLRDLYDPDFEEAVAKDLLSAEFRKCRASYKAVCWLRLMPRT